MPIYEYECTSCCTVIEVFQRMTEDPLTTCPECSGSIKKLMSMSSFKLKGGGWYADGYSSTSCNSSGSGTTATASKSSSEKTEKATDSSKDSSATTKDSSAPTKSKESCSTAT